MRSGAIPETVIEALAMLSGTAPTPIVHTFHAIILARAIMVSVKLSVYDAITDAPATAEDIADRISAAPGALQKLLNVLVAAGYLVYEAPLYGLSALSRRFLVRSAPQSVHDNILFRFLEWEALESTEHFVRGGAGLDVHKKLEDEQWAVYQRGMQAIARLSAYEVARRVRIRGGANRMLDIGGGHGAYAAAFCRRHPMIEAVILDLAEAVRTAAPLLREEGLGNRLSARAGNALDDDIGREQWDLIFISHLAHHFSDADNAALMRRVTVALKPGGTVAILDVIRAGLRTGADQTSVLLDLFFAVTSEGGTPTFDDVARWIANAGLVGRQRIALRTAPGISVMTGVKT